MILNIQVIPQSSRNQITPQEDGSLKVKLTSPPVDGEANKKLIELLAKYFHVSKSSIEIKKGRNGKRKIVEINNEKLYK